MHLLNRHHKDLKAKIKVSLNTVDAYLSIKKKIQAAPYCGL